jgi:hypothetical protein
MTTTDDATMGPNDGLVVAAEPPSTIETALGEDWVEAVDWDTVNAPADVQRWVETLAKQAVDIWRPCDLDLADFAEKIRRHANHLHDGTDAP